jgi:Sec-independent protein translocase protein TatA
MAVVAQATILADLIGGWETVLILAVVLILFGARYLPDLARLARRLGEGMDEEAKGAGKSLGGIYGKPAHEALTPDSQTAELYDPEVMDGEKEPGPTPWKLWHRWIARLIRRLLARLLDRGSKDQ